MKGKLTKTSKDSHHNGHYFLNNSDGLAIGSTDKEWCKRAIKTKPLYILSLKNCQAIENGYDLEELFNKVDNSIGYREFDFTSFKLGAKAILELLGDKKFSEEDVRTAFYVAIQLGMNQNIAIDKNKPLQDEEVVFNKTIQSLQKTEWDVEIVMEENCPFDYTSRCTQGRCDCKKPKLDSNGFLILKRK